MAPFSSLWRKSSNAAGVTEKTSAPVAQVSSHSSEEKSFFKAGDETIVHDAEDTSPGSLTLEEGESAFRRFAGSLLTMVQTQRVVWAATWESSVARC